jgi:hypothetical protein
MLQLYEVFDASEQQLATELHQIRALLLQDPCRGDFARSVRAPSDLAGAITSLTRAKLCWPAYGTARSLTHLEGCIIQELDERGCSQEVSLQLVRFAGMQLAHSHAQVAQ